MSPFSSAATQAGNLSWQPNALAAQALNYCVICLRAILLSMPVVRQRLIHLNPIGVPIHFIKVQFPSHVETQMTPMSIPTYGAYHIVSICVPHPMSRQQKLRGTQSISPYLPFLRSVRIMFIKSFPNSRCSSVTEKVKSASVGLSHVVIPLVLHV